MNKKEQENSLEAKAKNELQKTQQLSNIEMVKAQLKVDLNKELNQDVIIRDDLLKGGVEPSQKLTNKIDGRQQQLDELSAMIETHQTHLLSTYDIAKMAIEALRKYNPKKANELENSLALKVKQSNSRQVQKRRL